MASSMTSYHIMWPFDNNPLSAWTTLSKFGCPVVMCSRDMCNSITMRPSVYLHSGYPNEGHGRRTYVVRARNLSSADCVVQNSTRWVTFSLRFSISMVLRSRGPSGREGPPLQMLEINAKFMTNIFLRFTHLFPSCCL